MYVPMDILIDTLMDKYIHYKLLSIDIQSFNLDIQSDNYEVLS